VELDEDGFVTAIFMVMAEIGFMLRVQIDFVREFEADNLQLFVLLCLCLSCSYWNSFLFLHRNICVTLSLQEFSCKKIRKVIVNTFDKFYVKIKRR